MTTADTRLRAGILVDSSTISQWQFDALQHAGDLLDIQVVLQCENSESRKRPIKHFLYYLLNLIAVRNRSTRPVPWGDIIEPHTDIIKFRCAQEKGWEVIDHETCTKVSTYQLDVVVRFGMNLIKNPDSVSAKYGVLSYHHGDPRAFRGRPAGFYELLKDADAVGTVVQQLSHTLDAGRVRAFGQYHLNRHSYRRSLEYLFKESASLLRIALMNCRDTRHVEIQTSGTNFRLPSNLLVGRFFFILLGRKIKRLVFGLFFTRNWEVSWTDVSKLIGTSAKTELPIVESLARPLGTSFIADPFLIDNNIVVCEAMPKRSSDGILMIHRNEDWTALDTSCLDSDAHLSFPFVFRDKQQTFLLPEMAQQGPQSILTIEDSVRVASVRQLGGLGDERLIDPVMLQYSGRWWLFAGLDGSEADHLHLWSSSSLDDPFVPHRRNPIVVDPTRARNAGGFFVVDDRLFRLGQNNSREYGDGISVLQVLQLDDLDYREERTQTISVPDHHGPHTLSVFDNRAVMDHYAIAFNVLAWLPRFKKLFR